MGCAPGVGDSRASAQANAGELLHQHRERRGLSAMQMISAGSVDDDSIRRIGRDDGGDALQHAEREPLQRFGVCGRVGVLNHQALHQRLSLARGHADAHPDGLGCGVRRQHHPSPPISANQDQRRPKRRRCIARLLPDPVGGQGRQEDRDDPWHRTPPVRNLHSRRRGSGSVPPTRAGARLPGRAAALTAAPRRASVFVAAVG
jgi:hypothetical protein